MKTFTAAEISAAIGKAKRYVRERLAAVRASVKVERGQEAKAWAFEQLPQDWRAKLTSNAKDYGFRDAAHLLSAGADPWLPPVPIAELPTAAIENARKLQEAFARCLSQIDNATARSADFYVRGLADYVKAFGHTITERHFRRLLDRTVARAGAAQKWDRWELYLADGIKPRKAEVKAAKKCEHEDLAAAVRLIADPVQPTRSELQTVWRHAFDRFDDMLAEGSSERAARLSIVNFLEAQLPGIAKNRSALLVAWKYKYAKWEGAGHHPEALDDGRASEGRARRFALTADDKSTLLAYAAKHGGGISQGWREALRAGALSPELCARFASNPYSKSHVPTSVRQQVERDLALLQDHLRGPRAVKLNGPYIQRNPDCIAAGDWWQADDLTAPLYYWQDSGSGARLMRGQLLMMIDVRSFLILGFVLIDAPENSGSSYNATHIRNLITVCHDIYGLPRKGFYFERGTWKARELTGCTPTQVTEEGLRRFGLRFVHATLPRGKVVERIFGALQNLMERERGYVGRNEMLDKFERVQKQKRLVESGKETASKFFLSREEWVQRLTAICESYNAEPQEGQYLRGLSPREAFEHHCGTEPVVRLPDSARYLLANEVLRLKVGRNGISIRRRGEVFYYKNEQTGALVGSEVEAFWNYEHPETLGVKDPVTGEAFAVRRATPVPAMDATAEQLAQAHRENAAHLEYSRTLYRAIAPRFSELFMQRPIPHFRSAIVDARTAETGVRIEQAKRVEKEAAQKERKNARKATEAAERIGLQLEPGPRSEQSAQAIVKLTELLESE